jgi:RNA polymerase sigma-70 factor, ECF subfamily
LVGKRLRWWFSQTKDERMIDEAAEFERLRPYLLRVAYSFLGSISDAEDVVQEAWLRLQRTADGEVRDLRAWLTTSVSRLAINSLTSARARRERYVGTWLPEPVVEASEVHADPSERVTLDESVSMALLVVLESLTPAERSAFLLHDVFGYSFAEVSEIVGRTQQAVRQLASRARRSVEAGRPRKPVSGPEQRRLVESFLRAAGEGDITGLMAILDPDVCYRSDGGGRVIAARRILRGAAEVAQAVRAMARHYAGTFEVELVQVNGAPGLLVNQSGELGVIAFTVDSGRIQAIDVVRNPEKLRHVRPTAG